MKRKILNFFNLGKENKTMPQLSWWEQFILGSAVSLLSELASKITNPVQQAALESAILFLQTLLNAQATEYPAETLNTKFNEFMKKL
jgi:hypothetical protein